jgi:hypothetical protein
VPGVVATWPCRPRLEATAARHGVSALDQLRAECIARGEQAA